MRKCVEICTMNNAKMSEDRKEKVTVYKYVRDGVEYTTPNEQIAAQRSDTGEYFIVSYEQGQGD